MYFQRQTSVLTIYIWKNLNLTIAKVPLLLILQSYKCYWSKNSVLKLGRKSYRLNTTPVETRVWLRPQAANFTFSGFKAKKMTKDFMVIKMTNNTGQIVTKQ